MRLTTITPGIPSSPRPGRNTGRARRGPGIILGVAAPYLLGRVIGPWADPLVPFAFGMVLLASLATGRPLIAAFAQDHWRMVNAPHLVALVRAGATFINGKAR